MSSLIMSKIHATGGRALYSADTGLIRLTNQPTWRIEQRDGSGDELVFDRTNGIFRANGHARLQMPAQNMGVSGYSPGPAPSPPIRCRQPISSLKSCATITSFAPTWLSFDQDVRVSDRLAINCKGK